MRRPLTLLIFTWSFLFPVRLFSFVILLTNIFDLMLTGWFFVRQWSSTYLECLIKEGSCVGLPWTRLVCTICDYPIKNIETVKKFGEIDLRISAVCEATYCTPSDFFPLISRLSTYLEYNTIH